MSLYDDSDPMALEHLARHRREWTPEREAELQREFDRLGLNGAEGLARAAEVACGSS